MKLLAKFYEGNDVVSTSKKLIGKYLFTNFNTVITGGIIFETEAYAGITDRASHAFGNRKTERTEVMYRVGGTAYIYLCYGVHSLFNVVTNKQGIPHAVLIRGIIPVVGLEKIKERTGYNKIDINSCNGPGKVSKALGIHYNNTGISLLGNEIWIEDKGLKISNNNIIATPRIGVDYAGDDAKLPYRFVLTNKEKYFNKY